MGCQKAGAGKGNELPLFQPIPGNVFIGFKENRAARGWWPLAVWDQPVFRMDLKLKRSLRTDTAWVFAAH